MTVEEDYSKFKAFWTQAAKVYRTGGGEEEAKFYFGLLSDYPLKAVIAAVMECMKVVKYIPKPAEIIEQLNGGCYEDRARLAWVSVREAIRKHHSSASVRCDDPAVMWAIKALGGWHHFCYMDAEKAERGFCDYYITALRQRITPLEAPDHLPGEDEIRGNIMNPWEPSQIKTIAPSIRYQPFKGNEKLMLNQGDAK